MWVNTHAVPMYYPNAITLEKGVSAQVLASGLAQLGEILKGSWSVKDSFGDLDLAPLGFEKLFDAQWLRVPGSLPATAKPAVQWTVVQESGELNKWEAAWSGKPMQKLYESTDGLKVPKVVKSHTTYSGVQMVTLRD